MYFIHSYTSRPPLVLNATWFGTAGLPLQPYVPQSSFLSLITTGDRYCIGTKGWVTLQGAWLWSLKDRIDQSFMHKCVTYWGRCSSFRVDFCFCCNPTIITRLSAAMHDLLIYLWKLECLKKDLNEHVVSVLHFQSALTA